MVVQHFHSGILNSQQVENLSTFFISKLKDNHQVIPVAIKGLILIVNLKNYPSQHVAILWSTMIDNVVCQQQQQAVRYDIYRLLEVLMRDFTRELTSMGMSFTYGVISTVEGERDPRNLQFLLKLMASNLKIFPLDNLAEDMFDVFACYFPVDFKPQTDSLSITREKLSRSLSNCLCAVPEFGELCIQLALEKLESSLEFAKNDSLELLKKGCNVFYLQTYVDNFYKIWAQIQKEIFSSSNTKVKEECLELLSLVVNKISQEKLNKVEILVNDVLRTLKGNLFPEHKHNRDTVKILIHIVKGSESSSTIIISQIIPILLNMFSIAPSNNKVIILKSIVDLMTSYLNHNMKIEQNKELDVVLSLCSQSISDENHNLRSEVFDSISTLAPFLIDDQRKLVCKCVSVYLVTPETESVRNAFNNLLIVLYKYFPDEIEDIISNVSINNPDELDLYLTSLCSLAVWDRIWNTLGNIFINFFNRNIGMSCIVINKITFLIKHEHKYSQFLNFLYEKKIIHILLEFCINNKDITVYNILPAVSFIIKNIIGCQDSLTQKTTIDCWYKQLTYDLEMGEDNIVLLDGLISWLNKDVEINFDLTDKLYEISIRSENHRNKDISAQLLANIINKKALDDNFEEQIRNLKCKNEFHLQTTPHNAIITASWITKALLMRMDAHWIEWFSMIYGKLCEHAEQAELIKIIMDDSYECLGSKSKSIKMLLYQQRLFIHAVNIILDDFSQTIKLQELTCFMYILKHTPEEIVLIYYEKISKLILLFMDHCMSEDVSCIILNTIRSVISNNKGQIENCLEDYVSRILKFTEFENSMKIRIEALKLVAYLVSSFPVYKLLPLRRLVLEQLNKCVDDKKRFVRKEAMEAKSLWILFNSPLD